MHACAGPVGRRTISFPNRSDGRDGDARHGRHVTCGECKEIRQPLEVVMVFQSSIMIDSAPQVCPDECPWMSLTIVVLPMMCGVTTTTETSDAPTLPPTTEATNITTRTTTPTLATAATTLTHTSAPARPCVNVTIEVGTAVSRCVVLFLSLSLSLCLSFSLLPHCDSGVYPDICLVFPPFSCACPRRRPAFVCVW